MAYSLENRLVIGIASSALFDLTESDAFFVKHGEEKYRKYQDERIGDTLEPGVAFPFIKGLLGLNDLRPGDPVVEVIVLSKNDPSTGLRLLRSVEAHKLSISRAVFTQGKAPVEYIGAFDMSLFLSGNRDDVDAATALGFPAGHVLPTTTKYDENDPTLRVAFDFDSVLAGDESERFYKESGNLAAYQKHETENVSRPLNAGPLKNLLEDLNLIQKLEIERKSRETDYVLRLRVSLVTARSAPAHERAVRSLQEWGVTVNDAFFLGGIKKSKVLEVMHPHIFFDDQTMHLEPASSFVAGVHVPFGVANQTITQPPLTDGIKSQNPESIPVAGLAATDMPRQEEGASNE